MRSLVIVLTLLAPTASLAQWSHLYQHHPHRYRGQQFSYTYLHLPALGGATLIDAQGSGPYMGPAFVPSYPVYTAPQQSSWWWFRW